ncbi:MAG: hypothetical protein SOY59_05630 [Ligilactobacillus agilis]|nr:hypothetical protein [Ligilactobacillus agilis]
MNGLVKVNFQFMNSNVNTVTYIRKSDCYGLTKRNRNDRFIEDYEESGKPYGVVNLDQVAHVAYLDEDY